MGWRVAGLVVGCSDFAADPDGIRSSCPAGYAEKGLSKGRGGRILDVRKRGDG
jgi:hypothetical protein